MLTLTARRSIKAAASVARAHEADFVRVAPTLLSRTGMMGADDAANCQIRQISFTGTSAAYEVKLGKRQIMMFETTGEGAEASQHINARRSSSGFKKW